MKYYCEYSRFSQPTEPRLITSYPDLEWKSLIQGKNFVIYSKFMPPSDVTTSHSEDVGYLGITNIEIKDDDIINNYRFICEDLNPIEILRDFGLVD